jgi:AcrR family transcriptional regulator
VRTHGWSGAAPVDDAEAVERILEAARRQIDRRGAAMRITDVASDLGVTRQTVYRYFPSTEALLSATAVQEVGSYLDNLAVHLSGIADPAEAVVEAIAHTLERLPKEKYLGLLMTPGRAGSFSATVTSDVALAFGRSIVERFDVDWSSVGIVGDALDALVEFMLRVLQSFVIDPGRPARSGDALRSYLRQWVAPAIVHHNRATAATSGKKRSTPARTPRRRGGPGG